MEMTKEVYTKNAKYVMPLLILVDMRSWLPDYMAAAKWARPAYFSANRNGPKNDVLGIKRNERYVATVVQNHQAIACCEEGRLDTIHWNFGSN